MDEPLRPDEALEARLVENFQREGLDPLDEAEAYAALKRRASSFPPQPAE